MSNENQQPQQNESGKVRKQYTENFNVLMAILELQEGGHKLLKGKKADNAMLGKVVAEVMKEDNEEFFKQVKDNIKTLISTKVKTDREIQTKKKELEKAEESAMKEFNEAAKKVVQQIADRKALMESYTQVVKDVSAVTDTTKGAPTDSEGAED